MLVVMNGGRVEQVGAPLELYERPASAFVGGFLGSPPMNFLDGIVEKPGLVRLINGAPLAYDPAHFGPPLGAQVRAGVRPERVAFDSGADGMPFRIELIEELGLGQLVHGQLAGVAFTVALPAGHTSPATETHALTIPADAVHLFDRKTGARL
jgi:ABC-type sugar transport system ATPase subunit